MRAAAANARDQGRRIQAGATLDALLAHYGGGRPGSGDERLIDGLFVDAADGSGWLTGIGELSVSFRRGQPVTVRALSEILPRRPLDPALAAVGLRWGTEMLQRGSWSSDDALFREIYAMLYLHDVDDPAPPFRFGIGTEFGGESPVVKMYFDLHATRALHRRRALERIVELLGQTERLATWQREWPEIDFDTSRVIGVDFGADNRVRCKFYWGARHLTWDGIVAASRSISGERHVETLRGLEREVATASGALSSILVAMCGENGERSMKLDLCVARLYANDGEAYDAIERLRQPAIGDDRPAPLTIVTGGLEHRATACVQQYVGMELPGHRPPRITIYYRPIGFETEHLNPALRPRMCA